MTDAAEIQRILLAQAEQLRQYVHRQIPHRYRAVLSAEDVLQEVWITATRTYSPDHPSTERWLTTIARTKLLDALSALRAQKRGGGQGMVRDLRSRQSSRDDLFARVSDRRTTPSKLVAANESRHLIQIAMGRLPDLRRNVIQWRHIEGLSIREIADRTEKSEAAIKLLLRRALEELRYFVGEASRYFSDA